MEDPEPLERGDRGPSPRTVHEDPVHPQSVAGEQAGSLEGPGRGRDPMALASVRGPRPRTPDALAFTSTSPRRPDSRSSSAAGRRFLAGSGIPSVDAVPSLGADMPPLPARTLAPVRKSRRLHKRLARDPTHERFLPQSRPRRSRLE